MIWWGSWSLSSRSILADFRLSGSERLHRESHYSAATAVDHTSTSTGSWQKIMALRWVRPRGSTHRLHVEPHRHGEAQRHRSPGLARRCARADRRHPTEPPPRTASLELVRHRRSTPSCQIRGSHRMHTHLPHGQHYGMRPARRGWWIGIPSEKRRGFHWTRLRTIQRSR